MKEPMLYDLGTTRTVIDVFGGYNRNLRIGDGEFSDMKNMSSDSYPVLSPRGKRGLYKANVNVHGMVGRESLWYISGSKIVNGSNAYEMGFSADEDVIGKRQLINMGAYIIIMPDKKYINTANTEDRGDIEATFTPTYGSIALSLCNYDGSLEYDIDVSSPTEPTENLTDGFGWIDTSSDPHVYKQYDEKNERFVTVADTYIRMSFTDIPGADLFNAGDTIEIAGIQDEEYSYINGKYLIEAVPNVSSFVIKGIIDEHTPIISVNDNSFNISRKLPIMDFVTESGNRLWGCRYGQNAEGEWVNEIYASKLGDFKNFYSFSGIASDSYAVSIGTDGPFTGAISFRGYPTFFKESGMHIIYGDYPAQYSLQSITCDGVQKGSEKSLAIISDNLFYKSRNGICVYDGSLPTVISSAFGSERYSSAVGSGYLKKYYVSMKNDRTETWELFVFDTSLGLWHKEDARETVYFAACKETASGRDELFTVCKDENGNMEDMIYTLGGSGFAREERVSWFAETGEIGVDSPDRKYISSVEVRMSMDIDSRMYIFIQYDSTGEFVQAANIAGINLRSFNVPIRPRRCDHFKLKFIGEGNVRIYSLTKNMMSF